MHVIPVVVIAWLLDWLIDWILHMHAVVAAVVSEGHSVHLNTHGALNAGSWMERTAPAVTDLTAHPMEKTFDSVSEILCLIEDVLVKVKALHEIRWELWPIKEGSWLTQVLAELRFAFQKLALELGVFLDQVGLNLVGLVHLAVQVFDLALEVEFLILVVADLPRHQVNLLLQGIRLQGQRNNDQAQNH